MDTLWRRKKEIYQLLSADKRGFFVKKKVGTGEKGGKSKGDDEIFSVSCQKAAADKRSETGGADDGESA